jgi:hypothetical protein
MEHAKGLRRNRMSGTSTGNGKVVVNRSMWLDGFIAGPGDAMDWVFDFVAPDEFPEIAAATGALLVGWRTVEVGSRMDAGKERGHHRAATHDSVLAETCFAAVNTARTKRP